MSKQSQHASGASPPSGELSPRPAMAAVAGVVRNAEGLRRRFAADGDVGVSEVRALFRFLEGGGLTPRDLAESLDLGSGAVTALLDRLERDGLIRRGAHPRDRRMLVVDLTDEGRALTTRWRGVYETAILAALAGTSEDERGAVLAFLDRVSEGMQAAEFPSDPARPAP